MRACSLLIRFFRVGNTELKDLDDKYIRIIPWDQAAPIEIDRRSRVAMLSWMDGNKKQTWIVDLASPGIWDFNPRNFDRLEQAIKENSAKNDE